jgi:excisionase family DNA binding protein
MTDNPILTTTQVAERLGVTTRTVLRLIQRGDLQAQKPGGGKTSAYVIFERDLLAYQKKLASKAK